VAENIAAADRERAEARARRNRDRRAMAAEAYLRGPHGPYFADLRVRARYRALIGWRPGTGSVRVLL
jgi:hypothetical protein